MTLRAARIGVFGGTFDPPHIGHLVVAEQALEQLGLDRVLFIPAYLPPHKKGGASATAVQRLEMLRRAVKGASGLSVEAIEIKRKGTSYTVDTLRALRKKFKRARFFLIVGGDNYVQFKSWKSVKEIRKLATLAVYGRGSTAGGKERRRVGSAVILRGASLEISSTMVRQKIRDGKSVRFLVPRSVETYIARYKLYRH